MTLVEFLLARIVEEEANAADCGCIQGGEVPDALVTHRLAECKAKQRIVGFCDSGDGCERYILSWLAMPYADHPDYREEWRP